VKNLSSRSSRATGFWSEWLPESRLHFDAGAERGGWLVAARLIVTTSLLLTLAWGPMRAAEWGGRNAATLQPCVIEVLHSEMIPVGPLLHHTIKATLLVSAPDRPPFETTVLRVIPWQSPPPRQGQRLRVMCDPASLNSFTLF
jgi:hypothetical protein